MTRRRSIMVRFRPSEHLRRRADFSKAYEAGVKLSGRFMTVFVRPTLDGPSRLGIAATRKLGSAVIRNRAKRIAREIFRHHKPAASLDIVIVPRREFLDASYGSLEREFSALLTRARSSARPSPGAGRTRRAGSDSRI
jgi:ribonuclease P protein component